MIAMAAIAVAPCAHGEEKRSALMTQQTLQAETTQMMAQAFHERPADVFLKFAEASQGRGAENVRRVAKGLGRMLQAQVAAGGAEAHREVGILLEKGVRGAFARGLSMAQVLDVLTSIDLMGELLPEEARASLWRELARRPSGPRRPLDGTPDKSMETETGDPSGIDV